MTRIIKNPTTKTSKRLLEQYDNNSKENYTNQEYGRLAEKYNKEIKIERSIVNNYRQLRDGKTKKMKVPKGASIQKVYDVINKNNKNDKFAITFGESTFSFKSYKEFKKNYIKFNSIEEFDEYENLINIEFLEQNSKPYITLIKKGKKPRRTGAMFRYLFKEELLEELNTELKINIDLDNLKEIGIYTEFNENNYKDNCLYKSLMILGLEEVKLDLLKKLDYHKGINIIASKLEPVAKLLNIYIRITCVNRHVIHLGDKTKKMYHIDLFDNHYFIHKRLHNCSYLSIVKYLIENKEKYLVPIKMLDQILVPSFKSPTKKFKSSELKDYYENLKIDHLYTEINPKKIDEEECYNIFFDVETQTIKNKVEIYQICFADDLGNEYEFNGENMVLNFFEMIYEIYDGCGKQLRLIAHNSKFDFRFLYEHLAVIDICWLDQNFIFAKCFYRGLNIKVNDSYKYINMPLSKFPDSFGLKNIKKEQFPYNLLKDYKGKLTNVLIEDALKFIGDEQDFLEKISEYKINDNYFNLLEYSKFYCLQDCRILRDGYTTFKSLMKKEFDMDIDNYNTLSSISHEYYIKQDCFEGVYAGKGLVQKFIQESVAGGRCMTSENKKWHVKSKIVNFDGVSLYPSAQSRMKGYLKGKPKLIKPEQMNKETLDTFSGYFIQIRIDKVNKHRLMPILYKKIDGVSIEYTNDMVNETIIVDDITFNELIKYHQIEYTIIQGVYFNDGFNNKIKEIVEYMFDKRLQMKKENNESQIVFKMMLNSGFGRTILKIREYQYKTVQNSKVLNFIGNNYNNFVNSIKLSKKISKVCLYKENELHENINHIGSHILAVSKQIMNEIIYLAEDLDIRIYYQDTDSMHFEQKHLSKLDDEFKNKFNRELIGKKLGQFHNDFMMKDAVAEVFAIEGIYGGKKIYSETKTDGVKIEYECKMRGVSGDSIKHTMKNNKIENEMELFKKLKNEKMSFDLTCGGEKFKPKYTADYKIELYDNFKRDISSFDDIIMVS